MNTLEDIASAFNPHPVPPMLADLCAYWDENPHFFAGSFEVEGDRYGMARAWFQNKEEGYSHVLTFGVDGSGSLFAFWIYDDREPANAPVIFLGSEGEGNSVLADNLAEFFAILATNSEWDEFEREYVKVNEEYQEDSQKFQAWIREKFGIEPAADAPTNN